MDLRRLSRGDWLAAAGGVVMLVALFLPWYSVGGHDQTAWEAMAVDDVILAITALLAITVAVIVGIPSMASVSVASTSLAIMPAAVCLVVTVYRLVSPAPPVDVSLEIGAWLGLAAAIAIAVGAWRGANDEGPARRNATAERRAAEEALARTERLKLPPDGGGSGTAPVGS
jgi:hypothetical protein